MIMAHDVLDEGDAKVEGDQVQCCQPQEVEKSVDRALEWLGKHFSVRVNPGDDPRAFLLYYLYGLERTGRLTNHRFIGQHDWYREGADWLINLQEDISGFWRGTGLGENDSHIGTSLALLFLAKGAGRSWPRRSATDRRKTGTTIAATWRIWWRIPRNAGTGT